MKKVHLVVCDLFLPADFAAEVCADLRLPALEKMLARGASTGSAAASASSGPSTGSGRADGGASLENYLCELFGVPCGADAPVAPISAAFDGLGGGCWLRADPVYLRLQRDQLVLLPEVEVSVGEAAQLCAALNEHFAGQGMEFFAPHPQRWYLRLDRLPDIETVPLSQAAGRNVRGLLPGGKEAAHWHRVFNEIQMLLHSHPANEAREARGALPLNSLWLWGGGCDTLLAKPADCGSSRQATLPAPEGSASPCPGGGCDTLLAKPADCGSSRQATLPAPEGYASPCPGGGCSSAKPLQKNYDSVSSDEALAGMFAAAAGASFAGWPAQWRDPGGDRQLLVWTGLRSALRSGDLAAWRAALQEFETGYAQPLWQALRTGKIAQLQVDVLGGDHVRRLSLTQVSTWAFWRRAKPLARYSMV